MPADLAADVEAIVPTARWSPRRVASWDPAPVDTSDPASQVTWWQFVVADEAMMDLYELSDIDREALERTGVLVNVAVVRSRRPDRLRRSRCRDGAHRVR